MKKTTYYINDRENAKVGYAYVPYQRISKVYTPQKALVAGTVFPELDIPLNMYERGLYNGK